MMSEQADQLEIFSDLNQREFAVTIKEARISLYLRCGFLSV